MWVEEAGGEADHADGAERGADELTVEGDFGEAESCRTPRWCPLSLGSQLLRPLPVSFALVPVGSVLSSLLVDTGSFCKRKPGLSFLTFWGLS